MNKHTLTDSQSREICKYLYKIADEGTWDPGWKGSNLRKEITQYINSKEGENVCFKNWINERELMGTVPFVRTKAAELLRYNITHGKYRDTFSQKVMIHMICRECEILLGIYKLPWYAQYNSDSNTK